MFMSKYEKETYAILRIVAGFLFLWHGSQKLFHIPTPEHQMPMYILAIAGPIEFIGGVLIMVGLWTPFAAFIASGEMAFAYWTVHFPQAWLPLVNKGELAVLYCFLFLFLAARGSGILSIDHYLKKNRSSAVK
jgi:putative oxidoreductase